MMSIFFYFFLAGFLSQALPVWAETSRYGTIQQTQTGGVLDVTFDNNSTNINLYDNKVQSDLFDLVQTLQSNTSVKTIVFRSGNPDFFFAHVELQPRADIPNFPTTSPRNAANAYALFYNLTQLPIPTIAVVNGRARGAGNEFLLACDMRFATKHSLLGQPEIGVGLVPGAGGTQYLPRLIGRGRAMEYLLSGKDVTGAEAEMMGWVNRAFDDAGEMDGYVWRLARRMALFPIEALAAVKEEVNVVSRPSLGELADEAQAYYESAASDEAQSLVQRVLELSGNETRGSFELNVGRMLPRLYDSDN